MYLSFLKSKIHRAKATECDLHYEDLFRLILIKWKK